MDCFMRENPSRGALLSGLEFYLTEKPIKARHWLYWSKNISAADFEAHLIFPVITTRTFSGGHKVLIPEYAL